MPAVFAAHRTARLPSAGRLIASRRRRKTPGTPRSAPPAERSALGSRLSALGSRLSALGSRLSALGSRLSALGSRLSALGSRLSALGSRLSALGSRLSALGSRLSALGSRLSALGSRLSALGSLLYNLCQSFNLPSCRKSRVVGQASVSEAPVQLECYKECAVAHNRFFSRGGSGILSHTPTRYFTHSLCRPFSSRRRRRPRRHCPQSHLTFCKRTR